VFVCVWVTAYVIVLSFGLLAFLCCLSAILANKRTHYVHRKLIKFTTIFYKIRNKSNCDVLELPFYICLSTFAL